MVPPEILDLIDKTFLFEIEVDNDSNSRFKSSYKVLKDPNIIAQFKSICETPSLMVHLFTAHYNSFIP